MSTWIVEHGMVPLLVPEVFPPVDFSMEAHVFFGDTWHHPYISTCFCGKRFYFPYLYRNRCHCFERLSVVGAYYYAMAYVPPPFRLTIASIHVHVAKVFVTDEDLRGQNVLRTELWLRESSLSSI